MSSKIDEIYQTTDIRSPENLNRVNTRQPILDTYNKTAEKQQSKRKSVKAPEANKTYSLERSKTKADICLLTSNYACQKLRE